MSRQEAVAPHSPINVKLIVVLALGALFVGGLIVLARPGKTASAPSADAVRVSSPSQANRILVSSQPSFDFGSVSMAAGKVTHKYWIRNAGGAPIVINKMFTSCMCTTATLVKSARKYDTVGMPGHGFMPTISAPLAPNESAMVEVVFDPAAHGPAGIGRVERVVTIQTDREEPLELTFVANVTP
jgi:hypothetical protein